MLSFEEVCTKGIVIESAGMYNFTNHMPLACGMIPSEEYDALVR